MLELCSRCQGPQVETVHGPRCANTECRRLGKATRFSETLRVLRGREQDEADALARKTCLRIDEVLGEAPSIRQRLLLAALESDLADDFIRFKRGE